MQIDRDKANLVSALVVQGMPNYFVLEYDIRKGVAGAKVGPHIVSGLSVSGAMLETKDKDARLLGFCVPLVWKDGVPDTGYLLVGTDHDTVLNPDGSPCQRASVDLLMDLAAATGKPAPRTKIPVNKPARNAAKKPDVT